MCIEEGKEEERGKREEKDGEKDGEEDMGKREEEDMGKREKGGTLGGLVTMVYVPRVGGEDLM